MASFIAFVIYGASVGSLGAAIPALCTYFKQSEVRFGLVFTTRGIGYCFGTIGSAGLIETVSTFKNYKSFYVCLSTLLIGLFTFCVHLTQNFRILLAIFWFQGFGFGMLDTFANCLLPELWGLRVGPWMQALHCCFGIGAIIGPAMVGSLGFEKTFTYLAYTAIIPTLFAILYQCINKFSPSKLVVVNISEDASVHDDDYDNGPKNAPTVPQTSPWAVRILILFFFFIYVGTETGFGGWVTTYALAVNITHSEQDAAYLVSYFWGSLAFGRLLAIFLAIFVSNKRMLRFQLTLCIISSILLSFYLWKSYTSSVYVSALFGFALSSMFPLAMTMVGDYGFTM